MAAGVLVVPVLSMTLITNAYAQLGGEVLPMDHPAIAYGSTAMINPVEALRRQIGEGAVRLSFDERTGYLSSLLAALRVPVESQIAVFSKTSLQAHLVNPRNGEISRRSAAGSTRS